MGGAGVRDVVHRQARDNWLADGDTPTSDSRWFDVVAPDIANSWHRSRVAGVSPDSDHVPFNPDLVGSSRLLETTATPVIDWLADQLGDGPSTILLADADANILDRRAGGRQLAVALDRIHVAPGFSFAEEYTGTNGIGSALENGCVTVVNGAEHFRENLQAFTCVGAPLRHPVNRRLVGVLDVSCRFEDTNELMKPLVLAASREIESRMYAESSVRERMLLEQYLQTAKRSSSAVVSLNQDFIITNKAAATLLEPTDHTLLWEWASNAIGRNGECSGELRLAQHVTVLAEARTVGEGRHSAGVLITMKVLSHDDATPKPQRRQVRSSTTANAPGNRMLPGRSALWQQTCRDLLAAAAKGPACLITGEAGTGKLHAAQYLAALTTDGATTVFDAALAHDDLPSWIAQVKEHAFLPGTIILRHLDQLSIAGCDQLAALHDNISLVPTARLVATALSGNAEVPAKRLFAYFKARLEMPPLRSRTEDIADIVPVLLRGHVPAGRRVPQLQPTVMLALMADGWQGNIRELDAVLSASVAQSAGCDITLTNLPQEYRQPARHRHLASLERAEYETILQALSASEGNKQSAAKSLGIARSTLYRKMRTLGLDDRSWAV